MKSWKFILSLALCLIAAPAFSASIELQQGINGYEGTADTHIISYDGNQNQLIRLADGSNGGNDGGTASTGGDPQNIGGHSFIEEGDYGSDAPLYDDSKVILIKFDLNNISGDVSVAKIGLYYWYERSTGSDATELSGTKKTAHPLNVNRILKDWAEGDTDEGVDGSDAADNSGLVTWNSTGYELWQAIGVEGPEDIAPTESTTQFDPAVGGWIWFDVTESVKFWIENPDKNFGIKIGQEAYPENAKTPDLTLPDGTVVYSAGPTDTPSGFEAGAHDFVSSENDMADLRPKLVIDGASNAIDWELMK